MSRMWFSDKTVIDGTPVFNDSGYLKAMVPVARTGIQLYRGHELGHPELDTVRVYRPPEEVFDAKAMRSFAHRPVTHTHPPNPMDAGIWKQHAVGHTGDEVIRDGDRIRVPMMLCDAATIEAYRSGKSCELSMGYSCDIDWASGRTPQGDSYEAVQRGIRGNHLAIVPCARGGSSLRIGDAMRTCPNCSALVDQDAQRCPNCQHAMPDNGYVNGYGRSGSDMNQMPRFGGTNDELTPKGKKILQSMQEQYGEEKGKSVFYASKNAGKISGVDALEDSDPVRRMWDIDFNDREFSAEKRKTLAKSGAAMPHGGFPIQNTGDLRNAIRAIGRAKNPGAAKAHIIKRARALGATSELPEDWRSSSNDGAERSLHMATLNIDGITVEMDEQTAQIVSRALHSRDGAAAVNKKVAEEQEEEKKTRAEDAARLKKTLDALTGENAALKSQLKDAQLSPTRLDALVKERQGVIDAANHVLPRGYVCDGKELQDIRRDAVSAKLGEAAKTMNDAQIEGAFAALTAGSAPRSGVNVLSDALGGPVAFGGRPGFATDARSLADASAQRQNAWDEARKRDSEAWKTPMHQARN